MYVFYNDCNNKQSKLQDLETRNFAIFKRYKLEDEIFYGELFIIVE